MTARETPPTGASLSQVVSPVCRKFSGLASHAVDEAIRGSFRHNEMFLDEGAQVALQAPAVDARASDLKILHPELRHVGRQFEGHPLSRGEFVLARQDVEADERLALFLNLRKL